MMLDGLSLLRLLIYDSCTRVWFDIDPHLALNIRIVIPFNDRIICEIFSCDGKVVP